MWGGIFIGICGQRTANMKNAHVSTVAKSAAVMQFTLCTNFLLADVNFISQTEMP
jgi:hypothetical protein